MYKLLTQKGQLFALAIGIGSILISGLFFMIGMNRAGYTMSDDLNEIMKSNSEASFDFFNPGIWIVFILIAIALLSWLFFSIHGLVTDPKGSMKFLLGFAGVIVLFFIMYATSDAESTGRIGMLVQKFDVSDGISKLIGGGVKTAVLGIGVGFFAAVAMEVVNLFK